MTAMKSSGPATAVLAEPVSAAASRATAEAIDPASEKDYWHVNYMTRPYFK